MLETRLRVVRARGPIFLKMDRMPRPPLKTLVVTEEDKLDTSHGMSALEDSSTSPDPWRIATPTLSSAPPGGRRVFSFSSALDVSGASLDSVPSMIPELPLEESQANGAGGGDTNAAAKDAESDTDSDNDESVRVSPLEVSSSSSAADFSFKENAPGTIKNLDLDSSYRSESPISSSMEYSSRTLALFRVDAKLDDSQERKPVAATNIGAIHHHRNDKWVALTRRAQQHTARKHFPILLRWPSKVFALLMLIFALTLLVAFDERRLVALNLAEDRYVNTTHLCVSRQVRLSNYVESKGNTWVIILANVFGCSAQNMTKSPFIAVCLCVDPSNDLVTMAKSPRILRLVSAVQSQCSDESHQCLESWSSPTSRSLMWNAGPNGKFMHGETIPLALSPVAPSSSKEPAKALAEEPTGIIWGGESPAPARLRELDAVLSVACIAIFLSIVWFSIKVVQHRQEAESLSRLYGIS